MKTTHTPGPWITKEGTGVITDSKGVQVALTLRDVFTCTTTEEMINARLIAAAPDMKKALQYVLNSEYDKEEESRNFEPETLAYFEALVKNEPLPYHEILNDPNFKEGGPTA